MTFLKFDEKLPMKIVYRLIDELKDDPERLAITQSLTLNTSKPLSGLKGTFGLFGSEEWWENIKQGKMPLLLLGGIVRRAYIADQDGTNENDTIDLLLSDGTVRAVGIYVNDEKDASLFRVGHTAEIAYALDELKQQPGVDGGINYSKVALEMAVSLQPIQGT